MSSSAVTVPDNLPPSTPPPPSGPRRRRWWIPVVLVAGVLIGTVLVAAVVPVERYALAPGDVAPVEPRVRVDDSVTTYDTDGEVLFVTVKLPRLSLLGWLVAALDPDVDVKTREELFGDQTREENRQENLKRMGYSKELASYVALSRLGYDVDPNREMMALGAESASLAALYKTHPPLDARLDRIDERGYGALKPYLARE